jgi:hypothetical protein
LARIRDSAEVVREVLNEERVACDSALTTELKVLVADRCSRAVDIAVPAVTRKLEV